MPHNEPLLEQFFDLPFERTFFHWYRRIFSIAEIGATRALQWSFGALLVSFVLTFYGLWMESPAITVEAFQDNAYTCWPYFQSCGQFYFFHALPYGYSQSIFYMCLLGLMTLVAYFIYRKEWTLAHLSFVPLFIWKFLGVFVLTASFSGNFDYVDVLFALILLFFPYKLFFLRLGLVGCYFLSATIKFDQGWILGTYFTSLQTGLPIFGNALAPIFTNLVTLMELFGSWLLLGEKNVARTTVFSFFFAFHLYSGIFIGYRFPVIALSMLIILFGIDYRRTRPPLTRRSLWGWALVAFVLFTQLYPVVFIPGDQKLTLEGNKYGFYVFEANHECVSTVTVYYKNGTSTTTVNESANARNRCDPYSYWFPQKQFCLRDPSIVRIAWTFDHSVDGGPFYRIVDVPDLCALSYSPFTHNDWILTPPQAPAVGLPLKDFYYDTAAILKRPVPRATQ